MPPAGAVECDAPAELVWALLARPERWPQWSPHVAGGEGLGTPEVVEGSAGHVMLRGGIRIPARIVAVAPGESWSWQVAGMTVGHRVVPLPNGRSRIEISTEGRSAPWSLAARLYAPVVGLIAHNVARVAERQSGVS